MLVPSVLQLQIEQALNVAFSNKNIPPETAAKLIAQQLSIAIDSYIRSMTIIVPPGQAVATPVGPGATTSPSPPATII
jgi:hypothetical protein